MLKNFLIVFHISTLTGSNWVEVFRGDALNIDHMMKKVNAAKDDWNFVLNNGKPVAPNNEFTVSLMSVQEIPYKIVDCNRLDTKQDCLNYERSLLESRLAK